MMGGGQLEGQTGARARPTENPAFQRKYQDLTGRPWIPEFSGIVQLVIECTNILAKIHLAYVGSGRHKKPDAVRAHYLREVALPGLSNGRDAPSVHDMEILRLPIAKELNPLQTKAVLTWGVTKTARSANVATETALAASLRQSTMLEYCCENGGASVGGKTRVPPGAAAEYKIDFGTSYRGKTIREVTAQNAGYVKWLCGTSYIWRFPQCLNLFYGLHDYLDKYQPRTGSLSTDPRIELSSTNAATSRPLPMRRRRLPTNEGVLKPPSILSQVRPVATRSASSLS